MLITYQDGRIPEPINSFSDAPGFGSGNEVVVHFPAMSKGRPGRIVRKALDNSWLEIELPENTKRYYWDKARQEYGRRKKAIQPSGT